MSGVERVLSEDGPSIAVWTSGEGPPLLLIHGAAADHSRWGPVLPAFNEHFTVMAMDRRGRGESGDGDQYTLEAEVGDVAAVVDWAGEGVSVLGHSYGAICALEACLLTDNVRRLVLYEPPLGFLRSPPSVVQRLHELLEAGERDEVIAFFMKEVAGLSPEQVEAMRAMPSWQARLAVAHTIPREERASREYRFDADRFGTVSVPTLFLVGGDSPAPFRQAAAAAADALGDCRVSVIEGQRHNAMDMVTDRFTAEVLDFLQAGQGG